MLIIFCSLVFCKNSRQKIFQHFGALRLWLLPPSSLSPRPFRLSFHPVAGLECWCERWIVGLCCRLFFFLLVRRRLLVLHQLTRAVKYKQIHLATWQRTMWFLSHFDLCGYVPTCVCRLVRIKCCLQVAGLDRQGSTVLHLCNRLPFYFFFSCWCVFFHFPTYVASCWTTEGAPRRRS